MTFKHGLNFNSADNRKDEEVLSWELVSQRWGQNELDTTILPQYIDLIIYELWIGGAAKTE